MSVYKTRRVGQKFISEQTAHKLRKAAPDVFKGMTDEEIKAMAIKAKRKKNPSPLIGGRPTLSVTDRLFFKNLSIGQTFIFEYEYTGIKVGEGKINWSGARGPWIKTGSKTYTHAETGGDYKVGSLNVRVISLEKGHSGRFNNPIAGYGRGEYVNRKSQITKKKPSKRLKKRRVKNFDAPAKGRFPNPKIRWKWYVFRYEDGHSEAVNLMPKESPDEYGKDNGALYGIGPFVTERGARWAASHKGGLWQTVSEAEKLAKKEKLASRFPNPVKKYSKGRFPNPAKRETLHFVFGEGKRGGGFYNVNRHSLTTELSEATHWHERAKASAQVNALKLQSPAFKWRVQSIAFSEGR